MQVPLVVVDLSVIYTGVHDSVTQEILELSGRTQPVDPKLTPRMVGKTISQPVGDTERVEELLSPHQTDGEEDEGDEDD